MNRERQKEIKAFCEKYHMFGEGDGIVIGLSGGADSVYLIHFLHSIQEQYALHLHAVHVHHGIRGEEADKDEIFAEKCAGQLEIPFESVRYDIPALAKKYSMSEEETGRYFRYQSFREAAKRRGCQKIAVAHHRDDQAETVLFHLLRGSGLRGLGGIRPVQDDIIRPLLAVSREAIEQELRAEGTAWREDASNRDSQYARNKLRNEVIPYLQREIQPETACHIAETALQMQEVWEYMFHQAKWAAEGLVRREPGRIRFGRSEFLQMDPALQPYVLLMLLEELAGCRKDLGKVHVHAWMDVIQGGTGRRISLPYDLRAGRDYEEIWLEKTADRKKEDLENRAGERKEAVEKAGTRCGQGEDREKEENRCVQRERREKEENRCVQRENGEKEENRCVQREDGEKEENRCVQREDGEKEENRCGQREDVEKEENRCGQRENVEKEENRCGQRENVEKEENRCGQREDGEKEENRCGQREDGEKEENRCGQRERREKAGNRCREQREKQDSLPGKVEISRDFRQNLSDEIPKNHCTKWFDYAKIVVGFVWRHPLPGDYLVIDRQGHTKKLRRILLDQKIPREQRDALWVLADGSHILWAPQIKRTSMGYYVMEETKEVLVVHIDGERWNTL